MSTNNMDLDVFNDLTKNDNSFNDRCSKIAADINSGAFTIVELVEQLGHFLTNPSQDEREKGTLVLSNVLETLPPDYLSNTQLNFICTFYIDRLNDHHQVIPAVLKGILALTKCHNIPDGAASKLLATIFQNVPCQQQQQIDRHNIYSIFKGFLISKPNELQAMSFDLVYGVISAMDSERDPKNLLVLFNWLPEFLRAINLGHLTEEMFEVMACYFPVDFRAPPQDPNKVSREDLSAALCPCLCAIPSFAEFCLPLALEKLSSTLRVAKLDALNLLAEGCKTFEEKSYMAHINEIWSKIQTEVFSITNSGSSSTLSTRITTKDVELEDLCLKTLSKVLNKISQSESNGFLDILLDRITTMKGNLLPESKFFEQTCKFLISLSAGSKTAAGHIINEILPILINTFIITKTVNLQIKIFRQLLDFITRINVATLGKDQIKKAIVEQSLKASVRSDDALRAMGLEGIAAMAGALDESDRTCVYENLKIVLVKSVPDVVRKAVLKCFKTLAEVYPDDTYQQIIAVVQMPNNPLETEIYLESLSKVITVESYTERILDIYFRQSNKTISESRISIRFIRLMLEKHEDNEKIHWYLIFDKSIITFLLSWSMGTIGHSHLNGNEMILEDVANIISRLYTCKFAAKILDDPELTFRAHMNYEANTHQHFTEFHNSSSPLYLMFMSCFLRRLAKPPPNYATMVEVLTDKALMKLQNEYVQDITAQLVASIINKLDDESALELCLDEVDNKCSNVIYSCECPCAKQKIAFKIIAFVTKAVYMRGSRFSDYWGQKMLDLLAEHEKIAYGFKIIICDDYEILSRVSQCKIRLLYRQKIFVQMSSKLCDTYSPGNLNYLLAFGFLVQDAPYHVFQQQLAKIIKLIVLTLELCDHAEVLYSMLDKLYFFISNHDQQMDEYIQEFVPRFLPLAKYKKSMKVRIKALECLQHYTKGYTLYKLLPQKPNVIHSLIECLDDPKRLVRREAVIARTSWFLLDAPM